ncbi:MAG: IS1096 element passenger TnpR family protein [Anaerolineales bacterium]
MSDNAYVLRVRLIWAKGVWREIALRGDQTLHEIHLAILDAFEWQENDETYAFSLEQDFVNLSRVYTPETDDESHQARGVTLDDLGLDEGDQFLYRFGDSERNHFPIKVMVLDDVESTASYPDIVDENGESPDQALAYH